MSHFFYNSEAIFNVIGDYPVVDQFDVSYNGMLAGSTYDNYVTGSMFTLAYNVFTGKNFYTTTYPQKSRGLAFNRTNSNRLPSVKGTNRVSYEFQPWSERSGILRNIKIFSNSERHYDSMTPDLTEMIKTLGGSIAQYGIISNDTSMIYLGRPPTGLVGHTFGFVESFPFQSKFEKIRRVKKTYESIVATISYGPGTPITPIRTRKLLILFNNSSTNFDYWADEPINGLSLKVSDASKILFGFGDVKKAGVDFSDPSFPITGSNHLPYHRGKAVSFYCSPIIRGWKYGLLDGNPHYTSCVFRRDRYGQFRDMLEQRLNSAFVNDEENAPLASSFISDEPLPLPAPQPEKAAATLGGFTPPNIFNNFSSLNVLKADPPVRVNFTRQVYIESSGELIYFNQKPTETWSSNLSPYATSSLPYFDNESRNRGASSTPLNTTIISSLSDVFGNITI